MVELADTPRSYVIETPTGQVQRNQHHLNIVPEQATSQLGDKGNSSDNEGTTSSNETSTDHSPPTAQRPKSPIITRSRSGARAYRPDYKHSGIFQTWSADLRREMWQDQIVY